MPLPFILNGTLKLKILFTKYFCLNIKRFLHIFDFFLSSV